MKTYDKKNSTPYQLIQENWIVKITTKGTLLSIGLSLCILILRWKQLPPIVPLWYSLPWGSEQLALPIWLFILPLGSAIIFALNSVISLYFLVEYLIFTQLAFITSFLVSLLSLVALIKIITIVT